MSSGKKGEDVHGQKDLRVILGGIKAKKFFFDDYNIFKFETSNLKYPFKIQKFLQIILTYFDLKI